MSTLSVKECIGFGWRTFRARPWLFVQTGLLLFAINIGVNLLQTVLEGTGDRAEGAIVVLAGLISAIIGIVVSFLMSMGETAFFLRAHDHTTEANIKDLWHPRPFWKFVGASLIAGILIFLGFVLLIVPGIIVATMLAFVSYLVIEEHLTPITALKRSAALTKGHRWKLFQLGLATLGINILGLLALVIGLFVSVPVSFLAMAHAYRTLKKDAEAVAEVIPVAV